MPRKNDVMFDSNSTERDKKMKKLLIVGMAAMLAMTLQADTYTVGSGETQTLTGVTETSRTVKDGAGTLVVSGSSSLKRMEMKTGTLKFSGGTASISDSTATETATDAALFGQSGGDTLITDGAKVTASDGKFVIINAGTFTVTNAEFDATGISGHVMNAFRGNASARIVIDAGGVFRAGYLRPTGTGTAGFKETTGIDLNSGGELYLDHFWIDNSDYDRYGRINFNGGTLYPTKTSVDGSDSRTFLFYEDDTRTGWTSDQMTPTVREGGCYIHTIAENYINKSFSGIPGGGSDGGLHHHGAYILRWRAKDSTFNGGLWLESAAGALFALDGVKSTDSALGAVPDVPTTNIWITGSNHTLYSENGTMSIHSNRTVFIKDGRYFRTGTKGRLVIGGEIHGEIAEGNADPTGTALYVRNGGSWNGTVVLDTGVGRTNDIGRLIEYGRLEVTSGVTRVTAATSSGTEEGNALVFVCGDNSSYTEARGHLVVNGGTLESLQESRLLIAKQYAQVEVTNGGRINLPNSTYVNGLGSPATLTIADGGTVCVTNFQVANNTTSTLNLNRGGTIVTSQFWSNDGATGIINFDGGCVCASDAGSLDFGLGLAASRWRNTQVWVKEGGAVFSTPTQNMWLKLPLRSGVEEGETDGGLTGFVGANTALVVATNNFYTGRTLISGGGTLQMRVDNALPPGSTLVLSNGAWTAACKYDVNVFGSYANSSRTTQWLSRLEGDGHVNYSANMHVTNAVAPSICGTGDNGAGRLEFFQQCELRGDLEIRGDTERCGYIKAASSGNFAIDISGLRLKMVNPESFNRNAKGNIYKILDAPNGYTGRFDESGLPSDCKVKYASDGKSAFLYRPKGFVVLFK